MIKSDCFVAIAFVRSDQASKGDSYVCGGLEITRSAVWSSVAGAPPSGVVNASRTPIRFYGGGAVQPAGSVAPAAAKVTIRLLKYSPETIQIRTDQTVEWVNNDLTPHTVTSNSGGELNSGSIDVGATWRHTFSQPGTFPYFCTFHREMKGSVIVK
jgi:plastocyanin